MKEYDEKSMCKKCWFCEASSSFCLSCSGYRGREGHTEEVIHRVCKRCGYEWMEAVKTSREEPKSFDQILAERGLVRMDIEKPALQRPLGFEPVPIRGEPASVTLLRDRE